MELAAGDKETLVFAIGGNHVGNKTDWVLTVADYDVGLEIVFVGDDGRPRVLEEYSKQSGSVRGSFTVDTPGNVSVTLDNGYSRMRSKTITFELSNTGDNEEDFQGGGGSLMIAPGQKMAGEGKTSEFRATLASVDEGKSNSGDGGGADEGKGGK